MSCSTSHGSPDSLAAATQPNQIGQLYGSVSGSPGAARVRRQAEPRDEVPAEAVRVRRSAGHEGRAPRSRAIRDARCRAREPRAPSGSRRSSPRPRRRPVPAAPAGRRRPSPRRSRSGWSPPRLSRWPRRSRLPTASGSRNAVAVPSSRVRSITRRMTVSTASTTTPMIIARGARRDGPVGGGRRAWRRRMRRRRAAAGTARPSSCPPVGEHSPRNETSRRNHETL